MVWERHVRNVKKWVMISQFYKKGRKSLFRLQAEPGLAWSPEEGARGPLLPAAVGSLCSGRGVGNGHLSQSKCSHFYLLASFLFFSARVSLRVIFEWSFPLIHFILLFPDSLFPEINSVTQSWQTQFSTCGGSIFAFSFATDSWYHVYLKTYLLRFPCSLFRLVSWRQDISHAR